ncbi:MBL fold metallo-hydrolase [Helicobacter sp. 23-1048]
MEIISKPFGEYQTNCYVLNVSPSDCKQDSVVAQYMASGSFSAQDSKDFQLIIDPGMQSSQWVVQNCPNPLAILNTHGHFDHIWDNATLQAHFSGIELICHSQDAFLLRDDIFALGITPSTPTKLIDTSKDSHTFDFKGIDITFHHYPGHTPGCCMIEIAGVVFSGDFIFYRSIGRSDFAYSNPSDMRESLMRFQVDAHLSPLTLYPGHGESTSAKSEQENVKFWLPRV